MLTWVHSYWLIALPVIALSYWFAWQRGHLRDDRDMPPSLALVHPDLSAGSDGAFIARDAKFQSLSKLAALLLLPVALAQPQWVGDWIPQLPEGREIVLLVDGSRSMSITDFQVDRQPVDRLSVLKGIVTQFVKAREGDKFGVVMFGDHAYTLVPPTFDRQLVTRMLARVPVGIAGEETAIGEAIGLSLKSLQEHAKHRAALVLFTDGDSNAGAISPTEAVEVAVRMKVPVYTVDVGTDLFGHHSKPSAVMEPGEISLRDIASSTGGRYYQATSPQALKSVIADIGKLEKTVMPPSNQRKRYEWYWLPLIIAGSLLTLARLLQIRDRLS